MKDCRLLSVYFSMDIRRYDHGPCQSVKLGGLLSMFILCNDHCQLAMGESEGNQENKYLLTHNRIIFVEYTFTCIQQYSPK